MQGIEVVWLSGKECPAEAVRPVEFTFLVEFHYPLERLR